MRLSANLSFMFTELPMSERFAAARAAGFDCVEIQFLYGEDAGALRAAAAGMPIDLVNVPAGAPERGDLGLARDIGRKTNSARRSRRRCVMPTCWAAASSTCCAASRRRGRGRRRRGRTWSPVCVMPPGTGALDFAAALKALAGTGRKGVVAAEYRPSRDTRATLDWLPDWRRSLVNFAE